VSSRPGSAAAHARPGAGLRRSELRPAHDEERGPWLSARSPPAAPRSREQAPAPVLDAASFFAKLQRELSTDDLTDLMAVLSEFNDRVLTQSEAVRRAGVVLEHYGPIRAEFEAFIRRSGQGSV